MPQKIHFVLLALMVSFTGCNPASESSTKLQDGAANAGQLVPSSVLLLTSSWPLQAMTEAVVSDLPQGVNVAVVSAVPTNVVSRLWTPTAGQVRGIQAASRLLLQGGGYEPWTDLVSLPRSRVVDTAAGYYDQFVRIPDAVTHQHGPDGAHSHPGTVWATWLDPELARAQLQIVSAECRKLLPGHESLLEANATRFAAELRDVDSALEALRQKNPADGITVLSDGPYYQYLIRRLEWKLDYLHWPEADAQLSDEDKSELQAKSGSAGSRLFLMMTDRSAEQAELAESAGLKVVRIDLCERSSDNGASLASRLKSNIERLNSALHP